MGRWKYLQTSKRSLVQIPIAKVKGWMYWCLSSGKLAAGQPYYTRDLKLQ